MLQTTKRSLTFGLFLALLQHDSSAAPFNRIIAFGDSLTDTGQLPDPGSPTTIVNGNSVPTANLRLTNRMGPTYLPPEASGQIAIQKVAAGLNLAQPKPSSSILPGTITGDIAGTNYALAGAQSDKIRASIMDENGASVAVGGSQTLRNGYLFDNPNADSNALYYINGGGNDIIYGTVTSLQDAAQTANNLVSGVNALSSAGAKYIVLANVPDLGITPLALSQAQDSPALPSTMSQLTGAINQAIYQEINQSSANIISLDLHGLLNHVIADPSRYGFESAETCFDNSRSGSLCQVDPTYGLTAPNPNPDALIFFDDVHPTTHAQSIIADYSLSVLTAPASIGMLPALGLELVQAALQQQEMEFFSTRGVSPFGDWKGQYAIGASDHELDNPVYNTSYEGNSERFSAAGQRTMNENWKLGGSASVSRGEFASELDLSSTNIESASISAFMLIEDERYHSSGTLAYSYLRYADLYRHSPLGQQTVRYDTGDTDGEAWTIHLTTSYDLSFEGGAWQYGPSVDIYRTDINVDAYSETAGSITALDVGKQSWTSTQVNYAIFAQYLSNDSTLSLSAKIGLMEEYSLGDEDVAIKVQSLDVKYGNLPGYENTSEASVVTQVNLTYAPFAVSRMSLIYNSISGQNDQQSLAIALAFHF